MCAGIAEKEYGSLQGCKNGVFLGIGTGIGTAVFLNGKLVEEIRSAGHMIIERNGRTCGCGKHGCYETYASMKALKTEIRHKLQNETLSSKEILEILKDKKQSEPLQDILQNYIQYLSIGIANFARICSSDVVAIGGSFVYFQEVLFDKLLQELDRIMIPMEKEKVTIKLATLGNDAGIIGATRIKEEN